MNSEVIRLLKDAGFTQKEAGVYLALLELGQADTTDISKKAELKRPITYVILEGLIEKGYVAQLPGKKVNTYQPIDPGVILTQLKNTTKYYSEMLPYLRSLHDKSVSRTRFHYADTKEGMLRIYEDINNYKEQLYVSSYAKLEEVFPGIIKQWIELYKRHRYKFKGRHLIPDTPQDLALAKHFLSIGQEIRILPKGHTIKMDFTLYGDKVAISSLDKKPYVVVMESKDMVDSLLSIFEFAWKAGKKVK